MSARGRREAGDAGSPFGSARDERARLLLPFLLFALPSVAHAALDAPAFLGPRPPAQVRRVVTIAPSLTDTVLALGAEERLVGVSRHDGHPDVARLPRVGGYNDPSVESVVALRPDLVVVETSPGNRRPVERMAELGLPVLAVPLRSVAHTLGAIRTLGQVLGRAEAAEALAARVERTREEVRARNRGRTPVRVLIVYGFEPLVVAGPGSFAHELLLDAGGANAAADAANPFTAYPLERVVRLRPDLVVDASDTDVGKERLQVLPGLKEARWVDVPSLDLLQPGPRLGKGLLELEALLRHPLGSQARPTDAGLPVAPGGGGEAAAPRPRAEETK